MNASANNAVVELISLNIPFFINKLDAIMEYIGEDYPLYFNSISELEQIINNKKLLVKKIIKAYNYLSKLNKTLKECSTLCLKGTECDKSIFCHMALSLKD